MVTLAHQSCSHRHYSFASVDQVVTGCLKKLFIIERKKHALLINLQIGFSDSRLDVPVRDSLCVKGFACTIENEGTMATKAIAIVNANVYWATTVKETNIDELVANSRDDSFNGALAADRRHTVALTYCRKCAQNNRPPFVDFPPNESFHRLLRMRRVECAQCCCRFGQLSNYLLPPAH